jgi:O-antigen/teichoic acid export membrane protein
LVTIVGYMGLLDLGIRGAVTRFIAYHHGARDHAEAERFASAGLAVFSMTAVIAAVGGVIIAVVISRFSVPPYLLHPAQTAVVLCALGVSAALVTGVFGGIITARERFDITSGTDIGVEALRILALVLALRAGHGIVALAWIQLVAGVLRLVITALVSRRVYPELRLSFSAWKPSHFREIAHFGVSTTGLGIAGHLILQIDAVVIGWFRPVSMITFYAIAGNLASYARRTISGISTTVTPRISALEGTGLIEEAQRFAVMGARVATLALLPIVITFLLRGDTFIGLWMGAEYAELSGRVLWILSISLCFDAGRQVIATSLMGLNRHRVLVIPFLSEAVLNLTLSIILVQPFGIVGVAWGTTMPRIFFTLAVLPMVFSRVLEIPLTRLWMEAWIWPFLSMVPFALGTALLDVRASPTSLLEFFTQVGLVMPLAVLGALAVGLTKDQRKKVLNTLPTVRRKAGS